MTDTIIDHADRDPDICRFIHPEHGRRCGSPALRGEPFCYHHNEERPRPANPAERKRRRNTFDLAAPDSRTAIQDALGSIFLRIASNEIDLRRAGLLLYTLQIASTNLTAVQKEQSNESVDASAGAGAPEPALSLSKGLDSETLVSQNARVPRRADRAAIQDALGKLFPRIDDHQLDPRRAGLLLYCLQIASANLNAQLTRQPSQQATPAASSPSVPSHEASSQLEKATPRQLDQEASRYAKPSGLALSARRSNRGFSPWGLPSSRRKDSAPQTEPATPEDPIKGRPISRSTFAALLEAVARRQGIDVEKIHHAHEATILLRLHVVAEHASAPFMPHHHRGTNGVANLLTR